VEAGSGFGESEFISGTKRKYRAVVRAAPAVIGRLQLSNFEEVMQNYKQRVYYRKREMVRKCVLFAGLKEKKVDFIINNMKMLNLNVSYTLIKEGMSVDRIYFVNKGTMVLWKTGVLFHD
jgi:signal-transduction protein with cAMP-binding, CBS, and nucleotidyltransferase domain